MGERRLDKDGCEFGRILNLKVENIEIKLDEILVNQKELFNHMSSRVAPDLVKKVSVMYGIIGAVLGSIASAVLVLLITRLGL